MCFTDPIAQGCRSILAPQLWLESGITVPKALCESRSTVSSVISGVRYVGQEGAAGLQEGEILIPELSSAPMRCRSNVPAQAISTLCSSSVKCCTCMYEIIQSIKRTKHVHNKCVILHSETKSDLMKYKGLNSVFVFAFVLFFLFSFRFRYEST